MTTKNLNTQKPSLPGSDEETPAVPCFGETGLFVPDDLVIHLQGKRPWDLAITPLSGLRGQAYGYWMNYLRLPNLIVGIEEYGTPMRIAGLLPEGMMAISVPLRTNPDTSYWRWNPPSDGFTCMRSDVVLDARLAKGHRHAVILVHPETFHPYLPPKGIDRFNAMTLTKFLPASRECVAAFSRWLVHVMASVKGSPDLFRHYGAVAELQQDILGSLLAALDFQTDSASNVASTKRTQGLREVLNYLAANPTDSLRIPELCNRLDVSQRSLERAFKETFDMPLVSYWRIRRFQQARFALMTGRKDRLRVSDVAHRLGFYEMGHFSVQYARLFGEKPSETLARDYPQARAAIFNSHVRSLIS